MPKFYSPNGNFEVWAEKPDGYYTEEEWTKLHPPAPAPEPTKEEQIAMLDAQYEADKAEIMSYFAQAVFAGDEEEQAELRAEMAEIDAQYEADRKAIEEEEE